MTAVDHHERGHMQRSRFDRLCELHQALDALGAIAAAWTACGARESDLAGISGACEGIRRLLADLQGGPADAA